MCSQYFLANKQAPSIPYYQILEILKFENVVKFKSAHWHLNYTATINCSSSLP